MKLSNFKDIIVSNSEVVLDHILEDGLLKDIPIVSNLVELYSIKTSISDKIFYRKVVSFYESFSSIDRESFHKWRSWARENLDESEKVATSLVLHIDSQQELTKCKIIGHLFKKLVESVITLSEFEAYTYVISSCSLQDLKKHCLEGGDSSESSEASLCQRLQFIGFYSFTKETLSEHTILEYEITDSGCDFITLLKDFDW